MMKFRSARILDHLLRLKKGRHISPVQCKFCGAHSSSRPTASAALPTEFSSGNGGFFAGLASSPVVHAAEVLFSSVHSLSHLPWWAVIVVSTFSLRAFATLPLAVHQANLVCRIELLLPTVKELQEAVKHRVITECKREHLPVEEANRRMMKEVRNKTHSFYYYHGCHPLKMYLLPWIQLPMWLVLSLALRNMSGAFPGHHGDPETMQEFSTEGLLWIQDLTMADPYYILPVVLVVTNLLNIEMNTLRVRVQSKRQVFISKFFRYLTLGMGIIASQLPSAMSLYWAASSVYGLLQNVMLKVPVVRRHLRIPKTPSEPQQPFRTMLEVWREKTYRFLELQRTSSRKRDK
jgi:inner membrane protein COX18